MAGTEKLKIEIVVDTKKGTVELGKFKKQLGSVDKETKQSAKGMKESFKAMVPAIAAVTVAAVAMKEVFEFGREGAAIQRLEDAGSRLATVNGQSFDAITRAITSASGNTVSSLDAISQANIAMRLGVAKTPAEFEKLTTAAIALGRATGRTATESFADLTTGIGRQSKMILDNLGIVYQADKVYAKHAKTLGKNASQLTDTEKKQALLNLALESAIPLLDEHGNLIDDAASSYERLGTGVADAGNRLKVAVSDAIEPAVAALADMFEESNKVNGIMDLWGVKMSGWTGKWTYHGEVIGSTRAEVIAWAKSMAESEDAADSLFSKYVDGIDMVEDYGNAVDNLTIKEAWHQAAVLAIAGDMRGAQAIIDAIELREEEAEVIQTVIDKLMELDGMKVSYDVIGTLHQGMGGPSFLDQQLDLPQPTGTGTGIPEGGFATWDEGIAAGMEYINGQWVPRKRGGPLGPITLVGETGPELIINGVVIPTTKTKRMLAEGTVPTHRFDIIEGFDDDPIPYDPPDIFDRVHDLSWMYTPTAPTLPPFYIPEDTSGAIPIEELAPWTETDPEWWSTPAIPASGGDVIDGGQTAMEAIIEEIVEEAVEASADAAGTIAAGASDAMRESMAQQLIVQLLGNTTLEQMLDRLRSMPSTDEFRDIMTESRNTSGF